MDFDVKAAKKEIQEKEVEKIEIETAYKWASRAIACFQLHAETKLVKWLMKGEDYRHEALEHAALAHDRGKTLNTIEDEIEENRTALDEDVEAEPEKVSAFETRKIRLAQLMKDPEEAANAIVILIGTLAHGAQTGFDLKKSVKDNVAKISANELAGQQMQGGALVGQAINFVKAALRGQDQKFISETLNKIVGKL